MQRVCLELHGGFWATPIALLVLDRPEEAEDAVSYLEAHFITYSGTGIDYSNPNVSSACLNALVTMLLRLSEDQLQGIDAPCWRRILLRLLASSCSEELPAWRHGVGDICLLLTRLPIDMTMDIVLDLLAQRRQPLSSHMCRIVGTLFRSSSAAFAFVMRLMTSNFPFRLPPTLMVFAIQDDPPTCVDRMIGVFQETFHCPHMHVLLRVVELPELAVDSIVTTFCSRLPTELPRGGIALLSQLCKQSSLTGSQLATLTDALFLAVQRRTLDVCIIVQLVEQAVEIKGVGFLCVSLLDSIVPVAQFVLDAPSDPEMCLHHMGILLRLFYRACIVAFLMVRGVDALLLGCLQSFPALAQHVSLRSSQEVPDLVEKLLRRFPDRVMYDRILRFRSFETRARFTERVLRAWTDACNAATTSSELHALESSRGSLRDHDVVNAWEVMKARLAEHESTRSARDADASSVQPHRVLCPITLEPMYRPMRCDDGHAYEADAILRWVMEHGSTSPMTRQALNILGVDAELVAQTDSLLRVSRKRERPL